MSDQPSQESPPIDAVNLINSAWRDGRPIVFFLGSGFSVETGFPTIQQLCRYLAHLQFAFHSGLYDLHLAGLRPDVESTRSIRKSELIEFLGWPSPEQLRADLWRWLKQRTTKTALSRFSEYWSKFSSDRKVLPKRLIETTEDKDFLPLVRQLCEEESRPSEWFHWIEQAVFLAELGERYDLRLAQSAARQIFLGNMTQAWPPNAILIEEFWSRHAFQTWKNSAYLGEIRGEWQYLLDTLTEGVPDFVDSLFVSLATKRQPAMSHRYLAFLTRELSVPLVLTTNFDPFVEQAFVSEGLTPQVFDVFRDAALPHPQLVHKGLSVVKLHGSAYGLRVGERLQVALNVNDSQRLLGYLPPRAMMVLIGFSGAERRMMQFIEQFIRAPESEHGQDMPRVLWLHQDADPQPAIELRDRIGIFGDRDDQHPISLRRIQDAGTFLAGLHARYASTYATTRVGYPLGPRFPRLQSQTVFPTPPAPSTSAPPTTRVNDHPELYFACRCSEIFAGDSSRIQNRIFPAHMKEQQFEDIVRERFSMEATLAMANFAAARQATMTIIWIDLEEHHSVEEVVNDLLQKMWAYDPELPTIVLPFDPSHRSFSSQPSESNSLRPGIHKACERIWDAMSRRRYLVCFDQIESFSRAQTVHHGLYRESRPGSQAPNFEELILFLEVVSGMKSLPESSDRSRDQHAAAYGADDPSPCPPPDAMFAFAYDLPRERHFVAIHDTLPVPAKSKIFLAAWNTIASFQMLLTNQHATPIPINTGKPQWDTFAFLWKRVLKSSRKKYDLVEATLATGFGRSIPSSLPRSVEPNNNIARPKRKAIAALLLQLSVFRRPRSLIAIRAVIPRHWGRWSLKDRPLTLSTRKRHQSLDNAILALEQEHIAYRLEGEIYSLHATVHETLYKAMTESVRSTRLRHLLSTDKSVSANIDELGLAFQTCLTLGYWHRRIARFYYSGAYLTSRDLSAFWEYVYHRVAALRYLTNAEAILRSFLQQEAKTVARCLTPMRWNQKPSASNEVDVLIELIKNGWETHVAPGNNRLPLLADPDWRSPLAFLVSQALVSSNVVERHGLVATPSHSALEHFVAIVNLNRQIHIRALARTFRRMRDPLLSGSPASTIAAWCRHLLTHDLPEIRGAIIRPLKHSGTIADDPSSLSDPAGMYPKPGAPLLEDPSFWYGERINLPGDPPATNKGSQKDSSAIESAFWLAVADLESNLKELEGTAFYLRRDYAACLLGTWRHNNVLQVMIPLLLTWPTMKVSLERLAACADERFSASGSQETPLSSFPESPLLKAIRAIEEAINAECSKKHEEFDKRTIITTLAQDAYKAIMDGFRKAKDEELTYPFTRDTNMRSHWAYPDRDEEIVFRRPASTARMLRRTANCLLQFGARHAAQFFVELSKCICSQASKNVSPTPNNYSNSAEVIENEQLANHRREISLLMEPYPLWRSFDLNGRVLENHPVESMRPEIVRARDLARDLEDLAREASSVGAQEYFEYRSDAMALRGRCHALLGDYLDAHRLFDRAAAGLDAGQIRQRVPLAKVHLYRAEACALSTDNDMNPRGENTDMNPRRENEPTPNKLDHALSKLVRAEQELKVAESLLEGGRRDLTAWVYLHIGVAQVCIERMLLDLQRFRLSNGWPGKPNGWPLTWELRTYNRDLERVIQRGLGALRMALDAIPYQGELNWSETWLFSVRQASRQAQHDPERKTLGLWTMMMLLADATLYAARMQELDRLSKTNAFGSLEITTRFVQAQDLEQFKKLWSAWMGSHRFEEFDGRMRNPASNSADRLQVMQENWRRDINLYLRRDHGMPRKELMEILNSHVSNSQEALWNVRHQRKL